MAKKKTSAKKVASKTAKVTVPKSPVKQKPPVQPKPTEKPKLTEVASPVAPLKPKAVSTEIASKAKVTQGAISERRWPGIEKGYPDPFDVENEFTTATHRIFVFKKEPNIWEKYKTRKKAIPLG